MLLRNTLSAARARARTLIRPASAGPSRRPRVSSDRRGHPPAGPSRPRYPDVSMTSLARARLLSIGSCASMRRSASALGSPSRAISRSICCAGVQATTITRRSRLRGRFRTGAGCRPSPTGRRAAGPALMRLLLLGEPVVHGSVDTRMDDGLEVAPCGRVGEHDASEARAVEGAVGVEDAHAESGDDGREARGAAEDGLSRELVGVDHRDAGSGQATAGSATCRWRCRRSVRRAGHAGHGTIDYSREGRRNLGFGVGGRRDAFLDERVPFVAMRALPDQLGAAIAAAHADVGVEVEDRLACVTSM